MNRTLSAHVASCSLRSVSTPDSIEGSSEAMLDRGRGFYCASDDVDQRSRHSCTLRSPRSPSVH